MRKKPAKISSATFALALSTLGPTWCRRVEETGHGDGTLPRGHRTQLGPNEMPATVTLPPIGRLGRLRA